MTVSIGSNLLLGYFQAQSNLSNLGGLRTAVSAATTAGGPKKYAPTAPWKTDSGFARADALARSVILGRRFIDEGAAKLDLPGASADYKKLFALYQGLNALTGVVEKANAGTGSSYEIDRLQRVFARGLAEVGNYVDDLKLAQLRLTRGDTYLNVKSEVGVPKNDYNYVTKTLHTGALTDAVDAFASDPVVRISVVRLGVTSDIDVDLSELGGATRSLPNVVNLINTKLEAAGLVTRFSVERTPAPEREIEVGGQTVKLPAIGDNLALKVKGDSTEALTFSAIASERPSLFVATRAGDPDPDGKADTDDAEFATQLHKIDPAGATLPDTRINTTDLEGNVTAVRKSEYAADGSLYVLADVEKSIDGQPIKGETDTALLKYDAAGNLIYARTLGASDNASGLGLAIAADGRVAVTGSVTGELEGATNGALNSSGTSGLTDSFVTLYDASGDEVWTVRRGALQDDEATAVTFGDSGEVYVAGRTKSALPGGTSVGGWDAYVTAYSTSDTGSPKTLFTHQFGTTGDDAAAGIAFDNGQLVVASKENGEAVLRSFDVSLTETRTVKTWSSEILTVDIQTWTDGVQTDSQQTQYSTPGATDATSQTSYISSGGLTAVASRNLGTLSGDLAGLKLDGGQLYLAGHTQNGALSVSNTTRAYAGGTDGFAAQLDFDLTSTAGDALSYYGGVGDNTVAGFDVLNGEVWLAGSAGADLPGLTAIGEEDGYYAGIDLAAGSVTASQRLSGKDGIATASAIAINSVGASDLDKFGLPTGALDFTRSQSIVSATSARAGDTFQIRSREGARPLTITLEASDTLDTLAAKIRRKAGFNAKVEVVSSGDVRVLKISPRGDRSSVEILAGSGGADLLKVLGLKEGVARNTDIVDGKSVSTAPGGQIYGLGLDLDIDLRTEDSRKHALSILSTALSKIRTAYRDLEAAAKPQTPELQAGAAGPAPAYLQAQIANYQAGLNRLTGGG